MDTRIRSRERGCQGNIINTEEAVELWVTTVPPDLHFHGPLHQKGSVSYYTAEAIGHSTAAVASLSRCCNG